jgi:hypothetical protein
VEVRLSSQGKAAVSWGRLGSARRMSAPKPNEITAGGRRQRDEKLRNYYSALNSVTAAKSGGRGGRGVRNALGQ